jgi:hypothetical protein
MLFLASVDDIIIHKLYCFQLGRGVNGGVNPEFLLILLDHGI